MAIPVGGAIVCFWTPSGGRSTGRFGLNYATAYRDVDGIIIPTKRRVYAYEGDYQPI